MILPKEKTAVSKKVRLIVPEGLEIVDADEIVKVSVNIEKIATSEIIVKDLDMLTFRKIWKLVSIQAI